MSLVLSDLRDVDGLKARFEAKVDRSGKCHLWLGARNQNGYGSIAAFKTNGQKVNIAAHRLALALADSGPISEGLHALHSCDNRLCVNPAHLRWGTNSENITDKISRERSQRLSGTSNGRANLSEEDVKAIRAEPEVWGVQTRLARQYGVDQSTISLVRHHKVWKHIA